LARQFRIITTISDTEGAIMGGVNSGRRRSIHRGAVELYPAIDLRVLRWAGLIRPGECTYTTACWGNQAPETLSARIFVDLSDTEHASIRIVVPRDDCTTDQLAAIECVPCPIGGTRSYFVCPIKGIRCEQLFLVDGIFASRKAHSLTCASQSEDELSRPRRKVRKLLRQVNGDFRYSRPRGSNRWRTVQRLRKAQYDARMLYREALKSRTDRNDRKALARGAFSSSR
jgi:hypothetical protein